LVIKKLKEVVEIRNGKESCKTTAEAVSDHFVDVTKTIPMPKTAEKEVPDIMLTRYAGYLIAQSISASGNDGVIEIKSPSALVY